MDKSRICVSRTINLAKQKQCVKKTNILVYEKELTECTRPHLHKTPPIALSRTKPKRIKICTGAELKKMCPPKICTCPPAGPPIGFFGNLLSFLGLSLKAGIAGGLVYWTWDMGLWSDGSKTEEIYINTCKHMLPFICSEQKKKQKKLSNACEEELLLRNAPVKPPHKCDKPISIEVTAHTVKDMWNRGVVLFFTSVVGFPDNFIRWLKRITKEQKCPPE